MQSSIVSDAIENLVRARPGAIKEELGGEGTLSVPLTKESKRLSMKRRSAYAIEAEEGRGGGGGGGRCNCGKCFICVPTPAGEWLLPEGGRAVVISTSISGTRRLALEWEEVCSSQYQRMEAGESTPSTHTHAHTHTHTRMHTHTCTHTYTHTTNPLSPSLSPGGLIQQHPEISGGFGRVGGGSHEESS